MYMAVATNSLQLQIVEIDGGTKMTKVMNYVRMISQDQCYNSYEIITTNINIYAVN